MTIRFPQPYGAQPLEALQLVLDTQEHYLSQTQIGLRTFGKDSFDIEDLVAMKKARSAAGLPSSVTVVIPARNCERTVGKIVSCIVNDLMLDNPLVDEVLVIDHNSTDSTATIARDAGARVLAFADALPLTDVADVGKGTVMRKGVFAASGDIIIFSDADHLRFDSFKIWRLLGPIFNSTDTVFVKAFYDGYEGGRTTEAMARPVLSLLHPELAALHQPLTGEQAGLRSVFTEIRFPYGWGTEYRILDQVARNYGASRMAQVDVEYKEHEKGDSRHINRQAFELLHAALRSAFNEADMDMPESWGREVLSPGDVPGTIYRQPTRTSEWKPLREEAVFVEQERARFLDRLSSDSGDEAAFGE